MKIKGLIFDFDGLILDTESPRYLAWCEVYQHFNLKYSLLDYAKIIGSTNEYFHPLIELEKKLGKKIDKPYWEKNQRQRETELLNQMPLNPGVQEFLEEARIQKMALAIASSSDRPWVVKHLSHFGLLKYFSVIETKETVTKVKPDPGLYQKALSDLHLGSDDALAFEDAPHGITSAKRAGLFCIVIPSALTSQLDLSEADFRMTSFVQFSLNKLLHKIGKWLACKKK
jgi:HAD superfamily hydrolase (TIGR01509 family)